VIQLAHAKPNSSQWDTAAGASVTPTSTMAASFERPYAAASLVVLEQGLYALDIGETLCPAGQLCGLQLPLVRVSALPGGREGRVEIIDTAAGGETWLGGDGGTVIVKSPPDGGYVLVTVYGLPAQPVPVPEVEIRRLDRPRSNDARPRLAVSVDEPDEIPTEIVLHMERLGDRRFPGEGWIGNRGKKLRIEAFSIRPMDTLTARDIEFRAMGPNRRQTPWVTDAKLCGTRGQGLPLTGFAVRLAPHIGDQFEIVYQGASSRAASWARAAMASSVCRRSPMTRWKRSICA
jgi:hypothetical protein